MIEAHAGRVRVLNPEGGTKEPSACATVTGQGLRLSVRVVGRRLSEPVKVKEQLEGRKLDQPKSPATTH